jgi:nucleoside 2-deoxyribosyltransferase
MAERITQFHAPVRTLDDGRIVDGDGFTVEKFGSPINLMISVPSTIVEGDFEACLRRIQADHAVA